MPITSLSIDGMSCGHCVAAVKRAIESVPHVRLNDVQIGTATFETEDPSAIDAVKLAVEDAGYFAEVVTR